MHNKDDRPDDSLSEDNLENLLVHMRGVRAAIPVNQKLREELRGRLREQLAKQVKAEAGEALPQEFADSSREGTILPESPSTVSPGKPTKVLGRLKRAWPWWGTAGILVLLLGSWLWWNTLAPRSLEAGSTWSITRFWFDGSALDAAQGLSKADWVVVRDGGLVLVGESGKQTALLKPPAGGSYLAASISSQKGYLALIRQDNSGLEQLILVKVEMATDRLGINQQSLTAALAEPEVLYQAQANQQLKDLAWSPNSRTLALSITATQGEEDLFLFSLESKELIRIGPGRHPAWSPDGSRLVVERSGPGSETTQLWLLNRDGSNPHYLTNGEKPVWGKSGYLAYVQSIDTEKVLTYDLDGFPLFRVQQRMGEVRTLYLGANGNRVIATLTQGKTLEGDQLLLAPDNQRSIAELSWLRQLELERVREPRTLRLEPTNNYLGLEFAPDGGTLLILRQDGGMVQLEQIGLQEKIGKAR